MTNIGTQAPATSTLPQIATVKRPVGRPVVAGDTRTKVIKEIKALVTKRAANTPGASGKARDPWWGMGLAQKTLADLQAIRDNEIRLASTH